MKVKECRDYLQFENCIASLKDNKIHFYDMGCSLYITMSEYKRLVKFVETKTKETKQNILANP